MSEPAAIWAEYDVKINNPGAKLLSGFYFHGSGNTDHHLHIDFGKNKVILRDPTYNDEGSAAYAAISSGQTAHFVVAASATRYRVYINGALAIDFTAAAATPSGFGFDCASGGGTGSITVSNLSLYAAQNA